MVVHDEKTEKKRYEANAQEYKNPHGDNQLINRSFFLIFFTRRANKQISEGHS